MGAPPEERKGLTRRSVLAAGLAAGAGAPPEHAAAAAVSRTRPAPANSALPGALFAGAFVPGPVSADTGGTRMAAPGWVCAGGTQAERTPVVFPLLS